MTESVERAIICLEMGFKFHQIVTAFGYLKKCEAQFQRTVKQLRDAVRSFLYEKTKQEYSDLINYFESEKTSGRTAYYVIDERPARNGVKTVHHIKRLLWQRATQLYEPRRGTVNVLSLDFVYNVFSTKNKNSTFGHLTTLSPEGKLIVVAQFLVESENADAIEWVIAHFKEAQPNFNIKYHPQVKILL